MEEVILHPKKLRCFASSKQAFAVAKVPAQESSTVFPGNVSFLLACFILTAPLCSGHRAGLPLEVF